MLPDRPRFTGETCNTYPCKLVVECFTVKKKKYYISIMKYLLKDSLLSTFQRSTHKDIFLNEFATISFRKVLLLVAICKTKLLDCLSFTTINSTNFLKIFNFPNRIKTFKFFDRYILIDITHDIPNSN